MIVKRKKCVLIILFWGKLFGNYGRVIIFAIMVDNYFVFVFLISFSTQFMYMMKTLKFAKSQNFHRAFFKNIGLCRNFMSMYEYVLRVEMGCLHEIHTVPSVTEAKFQSIFI